MKMAKASQADINMAMYLCGALDLLGQRFIPCMPEAIELLQDDDEREDFDSNDDAQCGRALRHLLDITKRGSLMRIVFGCAVMLDPRNKLVDPDANTIEHHPDRKDSIRLRWLTQKHADPAAQARCREILERLSVMDYGAATQLIDDAMAQAGVAIPSTT